MKGMLVLLAFIVVLSPLGAALDYSGSTTPADPPSFDVTFSPDQTSIGFYDAEDKESSAVELALNGYKGEGSVTIKWDIIYSGTETLKFSLRAGGPLKLDPSDAVGADWEAYSDDNMSDEIDLLKYLLNNLKMQQTLLYKIIKKKEVKDEIYEIMRYEIYEYRKFIISLKRMLQNRLKKYDKELNVLLGVASSINANTNRVDKNSDYLVMLKESSKVNLMDIERVKNEYNIKSKTILKLIDRLEKFEKENINKIDMILGKK